MPMFAQAQRRRLPCGGGQSAGGGSGRSGRWNAWASGFGSPSRHRDGDTTSGQRAAQHVGRRRRRGRGHVRRAEPRRRLRVRRCGVRLLARRAWCQRQYPRRARGHLRCVGSGPFYVNLGLAYSRSDYSTTRNVAIGAFNERATGDFNGDQFASRLEAGFHFNVRGYSLTPSSARLARCYARAVSARPRPTRRPGSPASPG